MTAPATTETVLLVEDDAVLRDMYRAGLEFLGYRVEVAGDGAEGLAKAGSLHPDVIVLDIGLPEMDGLALLEVVRATDTLKDANVLILSNYSDGGHDGERAWHLGIRDYLVKADTTPSRLGHRVAELLGHSPG